MQSVFKAPKLIKTQYWFDLSFSQIAFHTDDWKRIRNIKITQEVLDKIKMMPPPRQVSDDVELLNDYLLLNT